MLSASFSRAAPLLLAAVVLTMCPSVYSNDAFDDSEFASQHRTLSDFGRVIGVQGFVTGVSWEKPGCHKIGHTRIVNIPGCVEFTLSTNACRGFCESWSIPSDAVKGAKQSNRLVTTVGQCCSMMETELIEVGVLCFNGVRTLKFKSALNCSCYHCKKE